MLPKVRDFYQIERLWSDPTLSRRKESSAQ